MSKIRPCFQLETGQKNWTKVGEKKGTPLFFRRKKSTISYPDAIRIYISIDNVKVSASTTNLHQAQQCKDPDTPRIYISHTRDSYKANPPQEKDGGFNKEKDGRKCRQFYYTGGVRVVNEEAPGVCTADSGQ